MPSYYYHLKFELYPNPEPNNAKSPTWIPPSNSDIFTQNNWPNHPRPAKSPRQVSESLSLSSSSERRKTSNGLHLRSATQELVPPASGGVIDCGPSRALSSSREVEGTGVGRTIVTKRDLGFPAPAPRPKLGDLRVARRDWRFDRIRVESFDMVGDSDRGGHMRGESSGNNGNGALQFGRRGTSGINAGLAAGVGGRVTKALYEVLEGRNTEVGWGVVHLYRDGEETPGLGIGAAPGSGTNTPERGLATSSLAGLRIKDDGEGEGEDCTTLCIPAVPSYLTPSDFLGFVGEKTREQVSHFRMVLTERMNRYLVLMKFRDNGEARRWRAEWDGKVFNSMEPETCHVVFIKSITFQAPNSSRSNTSFPELSHDPFTPSTAASAFLKPFPPPTPDLVELPTCPVCLERMDDTTGLLTILCQHVFHCACLQKWKGSGCPVCRHTNPPPSQNTPNTYPHDPSNPPFGSGEAQLCSICDCADDLWICLICGNVGCGRYKGGHAKEHWKEVAHNFALEIETQHVWDYAGDMWVHRLIRDKGDEKLIELPSSSRPMGYGGERGRHEMQNMEMVPREKLEGIGMEYTHLLTSQLESQRVYFEELVGKAVAKASAASSAASSASARAEEALSRLQILEIENTKLKQETIANLEKELSREKKKAEKSSEVARRFGSSLVEEKKVSEGLMERIEHLNKNFEDLTKEVAKVRGENEELKEENRDLLFSITAGERLKDMEAQENAADGGSGGGLERGEIEGGTVSVPVPPPLMVEKGRKGKGKGKR
ncbi:hypothetical protein HYALB_00002380 [Hymenoscyphus albidus]|uniref:Uncharacterized protein n=1 Tax=Hymenoscyphus albidus TaxID=595503 RepID=A0A9N9LR93_9HELO|nr:hypothetical protein HYALB_00002380 [Hymenoscyphus albidus]